MCLFHCLLFFIHIGVHYCIDVVAVVVVEINSIQFNSNKVYINWSVTAFGRIFQHGANKCQVKLILVFAT